MATAISWTDEMPQRIQLSRRKGWRKPDGAIVVARPSKWGNPFEIVKHSAKAFEVRGPFAHLWKTKLVCDPPGHVALLTSERAARLVAVSEYRALFEPTARAHPAVVHALDHWTEIRGRDLCCWCPLDAPCHADVLLELANQEVQ